MRRGAFTVRRRTCRIANPSNLVASRSDSGRQLALMMLSRHRQAMPGISMCNGFDVSSGSGKARHAAN
jgi:hypothetical protein